MEVSWRRERDSNPRYGYPHTRFPSVRLQPLGHPSAAADISEVGSRLQRLAGCFPWSALGLPATLNLGAH